MKARPGLRAWRGLVSVSTSSRPTSSICSQCLLHTRKRFAYVPPTLSFTYRSYHPSRRKNQQSILSAAVSTAQNIISKTLPTKSPPATAGIPEISVDPLRMVAKELKFLKKNIRQLLGSGHPLLDRVAKYYARSEGKQVRPLLVLLMSQATALTPRSLQDRQILNTEGINASISSPAILADTNPDYNLLTAPMTGNETAYSFAEGDVNILPSQRRLAEITELIHTASLLHDDVIDNAVTRRSVASANLEFGNKMAVLAGDFLLGRASVALARLRDPEVTELLATVIANLVEGEFMQLKNTAQDERNPAWTEDIIAYYLQKTYLKSASLISKSCRAAALLGQTAPEVVEAAYTYGRNLGLAFQLVDDMLDYTISGEELGKPAGADLELGLATAPLLFAWRSHPELGALVGRKFCHEGDVQLARQIVAQSDGLEQTRALAQEYADKAVEAISIFPDSEAKRGLIDMCEKVMTRRK
ncbi:Decaprenyl-diphosphate synthase, putative [Coccidioides posadasii C735 delta SOWgp]|uniref:Decaprenyl-diphosphate synthase, putative n=1 Tax=Coccidioides posadasii (strain C735) TaxID=222929 RepID=C5PIL7_COCP7|nr:Decaprenyl-diphosphate synthase, putative [Coccidioides posadasii C735 delta SOWgp]EER24370.1 Decaprenyl-diphosphate synthase, putative [Coccidioides posadasii C735 delta SOWgp]|eukprot:XP_003066515.1 Decaprenyl-diphosphate synthase, putative [Coccidioides posadasii C735 delta SOWgp]